MTTYPVKLLKDKDGTAFIPVVNSDSIITPEGDTLDDLLDEKQDTLISGTNLKTINNESLLGSGNITIQSGGSATDVQVNGTSITNNGIANLQTEGTYNASSNKIATMDDVFHHAIGNASIDMENDSIYIQSDNNFITGPIDFDAGEVRFLDTGENVIFSNGWYSENGGILSDASDTVNNKDYFGSLSFDAHSFDVLEQNDTDNKKGQLYIGPDEVSMFYQNTNNDTDYGNITVNTNGVSITGVTTPINDNDAVNKEYVDDAIAAKTDTKNTAGSTDTSSKIFLIGATSQAANPQTYSHDTAYVGTNGKLYSNSKEVVNLSDTQSLTNKTYNGYTLGAACTKAVVTSVDTSASLPTSNAVKTFVEGVVTNNTAVVVDNNAGNLYRYQICLTNRDGHLIPYNNISNATTTYTKGLNSQPFDPFAPIYYYNSTTTVNAGSNVGAGLLYQHIYFDCRYSMNINSTGTSGTTALTPNAPVYLVALYNETTGLATLQGVSTSNNYLDRSSIVQAFPSVEIQSEVANNFYIFIYLGRAGSKYQIELDVNHPVYKWDSTNETYAIFGGSGGSVEPASQTTLGTLRAWVDTNTNTLYLSNQEYSYR